jgi:hypothetical protein
MGGSGLEMAGFPTLVPTPPLTTPAYVGKTREVGGGEVFAFWGLACPAGSPSTPEEGEAAWRGARRDDRPAAILHHPTPKGGGWQLAGQVAVWREEGSMFSYRAVVSPRCAIPRNKYILVPTAL